MTETFSEDAAPARAFGPIAEQLGEKEAICPSHGPFISKGTRYTVGKGREVWTPCSQCVAEERERERVEAAQAEQLRQQERLAEAIGRAAIPARFLGSSFTGYKAETPAQHAVLKVCQDYARDFDEHRRTGESLVLIGRRGTGKTHLATAILQSLLPAHVGMYTTAQDMVSMIRATWSGAGSTDAVMKVLYGVPLLVVDEVGVQGGTENEQNLLFQVLDHRYRERKPVVLVGNMRIAEMQQYLGERVHDRLREIAQVRVCDWDSYRAQARKTRA